MTEARKTSPRIDKLPIVVALAFFVVLAVFDAGELFVPLDNKWTDVMFRMRGMEAGDPRVVIVAIDDEAISKVGQYPWPRSVYRKLLDNLFAAGVKVVGLDIVFFDPSFPKEDRALIETIRKWRDRVVLGVDVDHGQRYQMLWRYPFAALTKVAKNFGCVSQHTIDGDGMVRRSVLMDGTSRGNNYDNWIHEPDHIPSMGLEVLSLFQGKDPVDYFKTRAYPDGNIIRLNVRGQKEVETGNRIVDEKGHAISVIQRTYGIARVSAAQILGGEISDYYKKILKGSMVLVGSTAVGAFDHFPSPFTDQAPGVEVHANVIDNLLNNRDLRPASMWNVVLLILAFSVFSAFILNLGPLIGTLLLVGAFAAWAAADYELFKRLTLVDFTAPSLAIVGPFSLLLVRKTMTEQQEKRFIKQTFGQFVAPEVVDDLVKDPGKVQLGGEKRDMSVLFLDIQHFTNISEKMTPEVLIRFLNHYLSGLSHLIHEQKGVIDKYIGDCIMAFWNAPLELKDHRARATIAAFRCQEIAPKLYDSLAPEIKKMLPEVPVFRVGVNSGEVTVGLTGSEKKIQYTVLGDGVNLASRLEGANKFFGSKIMISEDCYAGAKEVVEVRELGRVKVVGKEIPIRVYEPLSLRGELKDGWKQALPVYEKAMKAYDQNVRLYLAAKDDKSKDGEIMKAFGAIKALFSEVLKHLPDDKTTKLYISICDDYSVLLPRGTDWDGAFNLKEK